MDSQTQLSKVLAGAAIGAGFAFLFLTAKGHRFLDNAEPWLDDVIRDLHRLRNAAGKAREAVDGAAGRSARSQRRFRLGIEGEGQGLDERTASLRRVNV